MRFMKSKKGLSHVFDAGDWVRFKTGERSKTKIKRLLGLARDGSQHVSIDNNVFTQSGSSLEPCNKDFIFKCRKCEHQMFVDKHNHEKVASLVDYDCPDCGAEGDDRLWSIAGFGDYEDFEGRVVELENKDHIEETEVHVIEGVVTHMYGDSDKCVCCEGNHRYSSKFDFSPEYKRLKDDRIDSALYNIYSNYPDHTPVRVTIEPIETGE